MFAFRYFARRYFPGRYFPPVPVEEEEGGEGGGAENPWLNPPTPLVSVTVGGADKTAWALDDWTIHQSLNAYPTMAMTFAGATSYRPARHDEIVVYYDANKIFGGVIVSTTENGPGTLTRTTVDATGYGVYADWCFVTWTQAAGYTLKQALQYLITNYLTTYSITLDVTQVDGPVLPALNWTRTACSQVLQDLCDFAAGYVWQINANKVLKVYVPGTTAAPWAITDATVFPEDAIPSATETDEDYADKIILLCGDTSTQLKTQTWTGEDAVVDGTLRYYVTTYPASDAYATGGWPNTVTVAGKPAITGPCLWTDTGTALDAMWTWDYINHRIIFNTAYGTAPGALDSISIATYTAQYPFTVTSDAGLSTPRECILTAPDIFDIDAGQEMADNLRTQRQVVRHELKFGTYTGGLAIGQALTVTLTYRNLSAVAFLISEMDISQVDITQLRYDVTALEGATFKGTSLDYWKALARISPVVTSV